MRCYRVRKLFSAYFDRELPESRAAEIKSHFAACKTCRDKYESFRHAAVGADVLIQETADKVSLPEGLSENSTRIYYLPKPHFQLPVTIAQAVAVVVILVAAALGYMLMKQIDVQKQFAGKLAVYETSLNDANEQLRNLRQDLTDNRLSYQIGMRNLKRDFTALLKHNDITLPYEKNRSFTNLVLDQSVFDQQQKKQSTYPLLWRTAHNADINKILDEL